MNDPQIGTKLSAVFSRFLQFGCLRHTNIGRLTNTSLAFLTNTSPACLANTNLMHIYIVISGKRMETNSWECDNCQKVSSNAFWYPKLLINQSCWRSPKSPSPLHPQVGDHNHQDKQLWWSPLGIPQFFVSFSTEAGDNWRAMWTRGERVGPGQR